MRLGVAALEAPVEEADDSIWMANHSNQIGQEKALAVIGIRASKMPPPGIAIGHQDVRMLMVEPDVDWKTEDMAAAYERLAEKTGNPPAVLTDGASELRDGADILQTRRENTLLVRDFKHFAAHVLKSLVGFIREHETKLTEGRRLPMSTEILESRFGLFKQLERQHSKGGFTSLPAAFGALLKPAAPESIRADFARVSVKQTQSWVRNNLGTTLASKRQTACPEFQNAMCPAAQ